MTPNGVFHCDGGPLFGPSRRRCDASKHHRDNGEYAVKVHVLRRFIFRYDVISVAAVGFDTDDLSLLLRPSSKKS